jgi:CRP/FNR family transcriptional regulator
MSDGIGESLEDEQFDKLWYLKKIDIFSGLSDRDLAMIDRHSRMKPYKKGSIIYFSDTDVGLVYLLKKGKVKLYKVEDAGGREMVHAVLKENEVFGSIAQIDAGERNEFAEALDDALVCIIEKDWFFRYIQDKPRVVLRLNKILGLRMYELEMLVSSLTFKSVASRLATVLMGFAEKFGIEYGEVRMINIPLTHYDIASMIGATRESTTLELVKLKNRGIIDAKSKKIIILDPSKLQDISKM